MANPGLRRLAKDVAELAKHPLDSDGIFYQHQEDDIRKGIAVITGPEGSAYHNGYYVFAFQYPEAYPVEPPKVKMLTRANYHGNPIRPIRLHPNLYANGFVCLSLLGTWQGEPWTSCCSIRVVLLALQSLFDDDPYLHEPKVNINDLDHDPYNIAIRYHNLTDGLCRFYKDEMIKLPLELQARIKPYAIKSINSVIRRLRSESMLMDQMVHVRLYSFITHVDETMLLALLISLQVAVIDDKLTESVSSVSS
jgi:ubiquitin-protein ligase